ncbi:hypothetical protein ALP39_04866 [Pseudomonas marginalis pv. marginalis]|nr:hypothetical protein ALP39_04866 [Pseudomonas marginalis pv. marginalis]
MGLEKPLKPFHRSHQRQVMGHAPTFVTAQHFHIRQTLTAFNRRQQHVGQHCRIKETQVHTLPRQRVDHVGCIADQRQALGHVAFGVTLAQRHADPWIGADHRAQASFKGALQLTAEAFIIQRHQALGFSRRGRPDNRAPILLPIAHQRQERQRAGIGKALPRRALVRLAAAHTGDDGVVQVIPFTGGGAGQATHRRVSPVGGHHQRRTQGAAIGQGQQPVIAGAAHLLQARIGQQAQVAVVQAIKQGILHHAVFDDVPEHFGVHAGGRKVNLPGAAAVPHLHLAIRAGAARHNAVPHAQALKDALAGRRQGAHAGFEGRVTVERLDAQRAAIEQQHLQATALQRQRQGASDHSGPDNQHICAHVHALSLSRWRLAPHVKGFFDPRHQGAGAVMNLDLEVRQVFVAACGLPTHLVQQGLVDEKFGIHRAFARRNEVDARGLVPDDVIAA